MCALFFQSLNACSCLFLFFKLILPLYEAAETVLDLPTCLTIFQCIEKVTRADCPICLEDLHTSVKAIHVPKCTHLIHRYACIYVHHHLEVDIKFMYIFFPFCLPSGIWGPLSQFISADFKEQYLSYLQSLVS